MGAKDSKPSFITYEEAVKRVHDSELRRIREAFKRFASGNGATLSPEAFVHEVLCDGVPTEVADWLYQACGGTKKGIAFKDLLCGIVVLTKGSVDEKIKFLWTLYVNNQNENGMYIYKWDFARTLHMENTSLPVTNAPKTAEILTGLFGSSDKVTFEQFRSWLLIHKDATVLSKWLLAEKSYNSTQDLETPTFYQSLAGVTHLEERDIIELEKCFWSLRNAAATSQLDAESLTPLLTPPLPPAAVAGAFLAFDENRDGHVDFKELCCGLSAACRGPRTERLKFCFKIFDLDRDGVLNRRELLDMIDILCQVANESLKNQSSRASTPDSDSHSPEKIFDPDAILVNLKDKLVNLPKLKKPVFQLGPTGLDVDEQLQEIIEVKTEPEGQDADLADELVLTQEDFLIWSVESADALVSPFLDLIFEVCHVVLGLRPQCKHQERDIVLGWLRRATGRPLAVGQFWYLVGAEWWAAWRAHCGAQVGCCRRHDDAIGTDDSFTTNSTESMGSLLYRADTASLGSASSSGVSSGAGAARHPGPVDNKRLLAPNLYKVRTLTGEGGHLRRDVTLAQHRDFELVPDALWRALALWYGGPDPLPRQVIRPPDSDVELELYPLQLKILRHVPSPQRSLAPGVAGVGAGAGGAAPAPPDKQLAYTAAFSRLATVKQVSEFLCGALGLAREDVRLWALNAAGAVLLDDERPRLCDLRLDRRLLLERRNPDLTWPEELGALSMSQAGAAGGGGAGGRRGTLRAPDLPGATGLHNLGNTCYMNAALQSVWNTGALTRYFNSGTHLYEVNPRNPLGTRGALALRYGELCKEVWSMRARSVAPLRVRVCVARWARGLAGGGQHDAQELLAWLLDALHEDLNRAAPPPPPPPTGPPARPADPADEDARDKRDQVAAAEAWEQHAARNRSIVTDLFYGQLKSKVRCDACGHESVRFDAFNMLSLPLPMEAAVPLDVRVVLLDGSVPVRYGVRVPADGSCRDLKLRLAPLCRLRPDLMLVVEVSGAVIARQLPDGARVPCGAGLTVYELPAPEPEPASEPEPAPVSESEPEPAPAFEGPPPPECAAASAPAQRSRSEILMSQSPPGFYDGRALSEHRSSTLPKDLKRHKGNSSPTLSVKSLNIRPSSPRLKVEFGSSPSDMYRLYETREQPVGTIQYLVAVHRKQCRQDVYFLPGGRGRPALFGRPVLVPLRERMSGRELYAGVWAQLARLLSARPAAADQRNHAADCDDSLGYEFPFTLRLVGAGGEWCCACPWSALCRGCALPCGAAPLVRNLRPGSSSDAERRDSGCGSPPPTAPTAPAAPDPGSPAARAKLQRHTAGSAPAANELTQLDFDELRELWARGGGGGGGAPVMLAIDWDPTALHLRYQAAREKACVEHSSVRQCAAEAARPVDLDHCLRAFTSEERLEEPYHCSGCRGKQPASKKLQMWRLPPILIIHLKRFQYVNNKWIKSQKVVNFPYQDFDPTAYLASVPQETILRHQELKHMFRRRASKCDDISDISESESDEEEPSELHRRSNDAARQPERSRARRASGGGGGGGEGGGGAAAGRRGRPRLQSSSLLQTPVLDDNLQDYHRHRLAPEQDPFDLKYRLYAVVSHSGQLSGGHYVAYARNPSGAWLCYNDSMCRELTPPPPIDPASAYLLFYERQGLDTEAYLPDITDKEPVADAESLDPDESDLKKLCTIA